MSKVVIFGGGTFSHVAAHLALAAPAFGGTAKRLADMFNGTSLEPELILTKMADSTSNIVTNNDLRLKLVEVLFDTDVKAIIMNAALCDFTMENPTTLPRLSSSEDYATCLKGDRTKIIDVIKGGRPDIVVAGFKTTKDADVPTQLSKGFAQMATGSVDFCLANDIGTHSNILLDKSGIITRGSREHVLDELVSSIVHLVSCKEYDLE